MGKRRGGERALAGLPHSVGKQRLFGKNHPEGHLLTAPVGAGVDPLWIVDEDRMAGLLASGSFASFPAFPLTVWAVACGVERSVARHSGATAAELSFLPSFCVGPRGNGRTAFPILPSNAPGHRSIGRCAICPGELATAANRQASEQRLAKIGELVGSPNGSFRHIGNNSWRANR